MILLGFPGGASGKTNPPANAVDIRGDGLILALEDRLEEEEY